MYAEPQERDGGFRCQIALDGERGIVRPYGELDLATVQLVEQPLRELHDAGLRELVIDLTRLTFLDSSGISLLVRWDRIARRDRIGLEIALGPDPRVRRPLELTGVLALLPVVDGLEVPAADVADV